MKEITMQQIVVSGLGGQGVLFVSRLLAETALDMGYSALLSETHGMAQRGGNVISHLKIWRSGSCTAAGCAGSTEDAPGSSPDAPTRGAGQGREPSGAFAAGRGYTSPLVRPGMADVFFSLHPDALLVHGHYLKPGGIAFCNTPNPEGGSSIDATGIALKLDSPVSANLVLLGFAAGSERLFCGTAKIEATLERLGGRRLDSSLQAYRAGLKESAPATARS